MRRLFLRGIWRLFGRRIGLIAVATVARQLVRRGASRQVDDAAADLEHRLPEPVRSALTRLPGDPVRLGGGVVVAGRSARQVAAGAGRVSRAADGGRRRIGRGLEQASMAVDGRPRPVRSGRDLAAGLGAEIRGEIEGTRRELRSRMLLNTRGRAAADDAMLDRRTGPIRPGDDESAFVEVDDVDATPPAVRPGRWRAARRRAEEPVARVQRTYQQPRRPWDR